MDKYVNIIVNSKTGLEQTEFTYISDIADLKIGHLVMVPFGNRQIYGIVSSFSKQKPDYKLKSITQIVLVEPIISHEQIKLAKYIANQYYCSAGQALFTMVPGFLTSSISKTFLFNKNYKVNLFTPKQKELIQYFLKTALPFYFEKDLTTKFGNNIKNTLRNLEKQEVVKTHFRIAKPKTTEKEIEIIRLNHSAIDHEVLEKLKKSPKQWDIYCYLEENPNSDWISIKNELGVSKSSLNSLINKKIVLSEKQRVFRNPIDIDIAHAKPPELIDDQKEIVDEIVSNFDNPQKPYMIFGRTGSGKTEIYMRLTEHAIEQGKDVIILVPEIALVPQTMQRFFERFGSLLAIYHSKMSNGEKFDEWYRMHEGRAKIVIGSRSALFSPLKNIGLIIIDEEHEYSFKQDSTPRYHAVTVAKEYSRVLKSSLVIGSATPRLETFWEAKKNNYTIFEIKKTISELINPDIIRKPEFAIVDLRDEFAQKNYSLISYTLQREIQSALDSKKQILLFLNRRGHASYVFCRECGYVATCPNCTVSLTNHRNINHDYLICHHCGHVQANQLNCPECSSQAIKFYGAGTQRVEQDIRLLFPQARIIRMDHDTTRVKNAHQKIFEQFKNHQADILIGTQMIAKGWDIPNVDLAGIVNADGGFHLPDFRATERNFALLLQLIGRVGRFNSSGKVVIQTFEPDNPLFDILTKEDYQLFAFSELIERKKAGFPPFTNIIRLIYEDKSNEKCQREALKLFQILNKAFVNQEGEKDIIEILGPAPSFFTKLHGKFRWHILLKGMKMHQFLHLVPSDWVVDIEPYSIL